MRFSEKHGYKQVRNAIQKDSMDASLRNRLWNGVDIHFCDRLERGQAADHVADADDPARHIIYLLWTDYFKYTWDTIEHESVYSVCQGIRKYFHHCQWYEVYDFLEFVAENFKEYNDFEPDADPVGDFAQHCNGAMAKEQCAWRLVGCRIAEITSEDEIAAIETAVADAKPLAGVRSHLAQALQFYAQRPDPDYRNSLKESISAVESLACIIAGEPKADLAKALRAIEQRSKVEMHGALKRAFDLLYAYTSDEDGVRHKMLDEDRVGRAEAQYMLVACSAFVSYLVAKSAEAGMGLPSV